MSALFALRDVSVRFGGLRALDRFSMEVAAGTIHALIGPNGAGKSTVFNCVSRFYQPERRRHPVRRPARCSTSRPHAIAARGIARTFQNIELCRRLTVLENVLIGMAPRIGRLFPVRARPRTRRRPSATAVAEAEALLERTGLAALSRHAGRAARFRAPEDARSRARARRAGRSCCCSTSRPPACATARSRRSTRCWSISRAGRASPSILVEHVMQLVMAVADRITVLNFGAEDRRRRAGGDPRATRG